MAIHHELQTVRAHYEPLDDTIHRQAHPTQSSNVPIRHTIIHNKIRKFYASKLKLQRAVHTHIAFAISYVISGLRTDHLHFRFGSNFRKSLFLYCFCVCVFVRL